METAPARADVSAPVGDLIIGAVVGTLAAAGVAWLWSRYGHVNLGLFFQVTAVFLLVFIIQLLITGFHELMEANIFPYSEVLHQATEPYGPDGRYGHYLSYMLVVLPLAWLAVSSLIPHRTAGTPPPPAARPGLASHGCTHFPAMSRL